MTGTTAVRAFLPRDLGDVERLCAAVFASDVVGDRAISRGFVSARGFDPSDFLITEVGGRFAGFALLAPGLDAEDLWLVAFGVEPAARCTGVGKALLRAALARAKGARRLAVGAVPTRYLVPGIDRAAHGAAYDLVTKHFGFVATGTVQSMTRPLGDGDLRPAAAGIAALADDEIGAMQAFTLAEFDATWWDYLATSLQAAAAGDGAQRLILVAKAAGRIVGFVHLRNNRFGPLAVAASVRGQGYGRRLTEAALAAARGFGCNDIYLMMADPDVVPFYRRLGFVERRTYTQLSKIL